MNYIFFPHVPWNDFPYRHLAELLQSSGNVFAAYPELPAEADGKVRGISVAQAAELPPEESVLLISQIFIPTVMNIHPFRAVVALLLETPQGENPELWNKYSKLLASASELIVTDSESAYTDLLFKYDPVLLIASPQLSLAADQVERDRQTFFEALGLVINGRSIDFIKKRQWDEQIQHYKQLSQVDEMNELVFYLQSFYYYLLGEGVEAASCLQRSFAACVLTGVKDVLSTRFRFLAAIHALNGETEQALHTYGITCISDEERTHYDRLCHLFEQGAILIALGELLFRIGDMRTSSRLLAKIKDERAASLLRSIAIQAGDVKRALSLSVTSADTGKQQIIDRMMNDKLQGLFHLMQGERRLAMRFFWRASAHSQSFGELFELKTIDRTLESQCSAALLPV